MIETFAWIRIYWTMVPIDTEVLDIRDDHLREESGDSDEREGGRLAPKAKKPFCICLEKRLAGSITQVP